MSKENKKPLSTPSNAEEANGIAQVQDLLHAVQRSLGGAQDKYDVLEADFNKQKAELTEAKSENAKLKKRVQKLLSKLSEKDEEKKSATENETTSTAAPFRPSRLVEREEASTVWLRDVYLNATKRTLPKLIRGKSTSSYAFCVLVMNRDAYALGATVLAHRLKRLNSKADIVCLVTRDVSLGVVEALASEFTAVFQVPYLEYKCQKMTTKKQQKYYGSWIERSFTKWNALALSMYKKVILLDADLLPVSNIDHLFEMSAPAATFSSPWAKTYRKDGYEDPFKGLRHGDRVDNDRIKNAIQYSLKHSERVENKGSYLALGSVVLLEPSVASYGIFNAFVCSQQPFGIPGCHSGFDEQSIALFYYLQNPETQWTHISQGYNALCWHENWLEGCDVKCYHYFNAKPWEMRPDMYPDLRMWYQAMYELTCENSQSGYLAEVCMTDTSFLDVYIKMTCDTTGVNGEALCDGVLPLKPVLPHDGASEGSSTSSPRVVDRKSTKPPTSGNKNKTTSSSPPEETADPPKIEGPRSEKALSVCSDKSSKHSETASVRSRESNRSAVLSSSASQKQRMMYYDEYDRHAVRDHMSRSRHSVDRMAHGPMGMGGGLDDYAAVYGRDGLLRKSVPLRPDVYTSSEYRRMKKYESRRDYGKEMMPQPRVASEMWIPKNRVGMGYAAEGMYERARHPHALSHSPVNTRSISRFESFGSSTSSGSYRLPVTPKHDRRHHF